MSTNVKNQGVGANKSKRTVRGVFNMMLKYYIGQMKRETFYVDGSCQGIYRMVVEAITKDIAEDFTKASEYAKILEMADRFYKIVLDKHVRERVIDEDMKPEDFMKYYEDKILGEYKRTFDMSSKYQAGLIIVEDQTSTRTVEGDEIFTFRKNDGKGSIPYTRMDEIFEDARQEIEKRKVEKQSQEPRQEVFVKKGLKPKEIDGEVFVFDHDEGQVVLQEVGYLEYTAGNISGNIIRKYRVRKEFEGREAKDEYVFSNIYLYEMGENPKYCEAVLGELLSDNNMNRSNVAGYIGELSCDIGELRQMNIGEEKDFGDYIYKTAYKSKGGKYYGLIYDSQDLSAVVEFKKQQEREEAQQKQEKDTTVEKKKTDDAMEL